MSLSNEERKAVVQLQIEKAIKSFHQITALKELGYWDIIANRLYYSAFHAACALLINDGHSVSTHQGVVAVLGMHYVKPNIISREEGKLYSRLQTIRENSDYNCHCEVDEQEISPLILPTKQLIEKFILIIEQKRQQ